MDKKTITLCLIGSFGIVAANRAIAKHAFPKPATLVGLTFAFIVLGFAAEVSRGVEQLAAFFAVLIFTGILLTQGVPVFQGISKLSGGKK